MNKQFNSKYNIGQNVAEGIYNDLTLAFNSLERGSFDKAFNKFKTIKSKIPSNKIIKGFRDKFKVLDSLYLKAEEKNDYKTKYKIISKYSEILVMALDKNQMYLPSLRDTSQFA